MMLYITHIFFERRWTFLKKLESRRLPTSCEGAPTARGMWKKIIEVMLNPKLIGYCVRNTL